MAETGEGNPATNFQKTVGVQNERFEAAKKPLNLIDRLRGKYVYGSVESNYNTGQGGTVSTSIVSGDATLNQRWLFDRNGDLISVEVRRRLGGNSAGGMTVAKGKDGKFQVEQAHSTGVLAGWVEEFHNAQARMAVNKPAATPPPQK